MQRNSILPLLLLAVPVLSQAQPVLTFANTAPTPGSSFTLHYGPYVSPGEAGADRHWDLSALQTDSTVFIERVQPGTTPNGTAFPGATVAEVGSEATMYFRSASDGVYFVGSDADLVIYNTDQAKYLPFPCTYQTSWTDAFAAEFEVEDIQVFRSGQVSGVADGYGSLTMPSGTESNVLRVHWHEETLDSTDLFSMRTVYDSYLFYGVGRSYPLAQLVTTSVEFFDQTSTITYAQWVDEVSTGTPEPTHVDRQLDLYPVPTQGILHFNLPPTFSGTPLIVITDAAGRTVRGLPTARWSGSTGRLDLSGLAPGLYQFTAIDEHGQRAVRSMVVE
jgi:hypothetical protein